MAAAGVALLVLLAAIGSTVDSASQRSFTPITEDGTPPMVGDHWHWAYGIYVCDGFLDPLVDAEADISGIHTHGEGVIHIHPFEPSYAGRNATLEEFLFMVGATYSPTSLTVLDARSGQERTYSSCDGGPAQLRATVWDLDRAGTPSRPVEGDLGALHFDKDRQAITIALVPAGTEVPLPPSIVTLDELTDVPSRRVPDTTSTTADGRRRPGSTTTEPARPA